MEMIESSTIFEQSDTILNYLATEDNSHVHAKRVSEKCEINDNAYTLRILKHLVDEKYVSSSIYPSPLNRAMEGSEYLKPEEYWILTIKGRLLLNNNGYAGLIATQKKETTLRWSLTIASWIVGGYAFLKFLMGFAIPFSLWIFSCE